jgi:hypothetical protein
MINNGLLLLTASLAILTVESGKIPLKDCSIQALKEERIGGFVLYRVNPLNGKLEYLLLKKADENDWSPPKGKDL